MMSKAPVSSSEGENWSSKTFSRSRVSADPTTPRARSDIAVTPPGRTAEFMELSLEEGTQTRRDYQ